MKPSTALILLLPAFASISSTSPVEQDQYQHQQTKPESRSVQITDSETHPGLLFIPATILSAKFMIGLTVGMNVLSFFLPIALKETVFKKHGRPIEDRYEKGKKGGKGKKGKREEEELGNEGEGVSGLPADCKQK